MKNKYILILIITIFIICLVLNIIIHNKHETDVKNITYSPKIYPEKIKSLVDDLARDREFIDINGEKFEIAQKANWDLRKIGEPVIPYLIEELKSNRSIRARQYALSIIYSLNENDDTKLMGSLPVFIKSMEDKEIEVRCTAVAQIGNMAKRFYSYNKQEYLEQVIPYLTKALDDVDISVQAMAGNYLYVLGRMDLVPEELVKEAEIGMWTQ